jgi:hypothetical protein
MSYPVPQIFKLIRDRLTGDATLTGYLGATGSVFWNEAPSETALAYVVLNQVSTERDDGFRGRGRRMTFDVHVFVRETSSGLDSVTRVANIMDRIDGDWDEQNATTAPTYGLDRFRPSLTGTGAWSADIIEYVGDRDASEPGFRHYVMTYTVGLYKQGV